MVSIKRGAFLLSRLFGLVFNEVYKKDSGRFTAACFLLKFASKMVFSY